jgi:Holliday junction resolvase-like predicted endonuclease
MIDLNEIKQRILKSEQIEDIIQDMDWREFEKLIAEILKRHDFNVHNNFRFKTDRRFEIDILATRNKTSLLIDCKQWGRGRYKKTGLKYSVKEQKERTRQLKKFLKNNPAAQAELKIKKTTKFIPLLVTWFEEEILEHENVFIIPVWKFNEFLLSISEYI